MNAQAFSQFVPRTAQRMTALLSSTTSGGVAAPAPLGLPAGAIYLPSQNVIFAATACRSRVFDDAVWAAAALTGADIVIAHQGRYPIPNILDHVTFTALIHVGGLPRLFEQMVLYWQSSDGYWLLPSEPGPFVALAPDGPRLSSRAPFLDCRDRAAGVAAAAGRIIRATRFTGAL